VEADGWKEAPQYVIRNRDAIYGDIFIRRLGRWVFVPGRPRRDRRGKTDMPNG